MTIYRLRFEASISLNKTTQFEGWVADRAGKGHGFVFERSQLQRDGGGGGGGGMDGKRVLFSIANMSFVIVLVFLGYPLEGAVAAAVVLQWPQWRLPR